MPDLRYHPALPTAASENGFLQTITLVQGEKPIGIARWHASAGSDGVVQLVELLISEPHRRVGNGSELLRAVIEQARGYHQLGSVDFRRVWTQVEQKTQVNARAFLGKHGFHHISTITNLHRKQDSLIYLKTLD
jgi:GNAT superfamily N-acetyltransferase